MAIITVMRPDEVAQPAGNVAYAPRRELDDGAHLILIENGKPRARDLMQMVAEELQGRYPISTVEVFSKASASRPIDPEEAKVMAARAHLVITGLGD
jgi:hypothetical protein